MNVLLTGATGFIGSYILKLFISEGHTVIGYDNTLANTSIQDILTEEEIKSCTLLQGDVGDLPRILNICKENQIDTIVHLAGLLASAEENCPEAVRINIMGTINMFEAARILGIRRVVWASSQTIFGPPSKHSEEWIPNDAPHFPWSVYSACKSYLEYMGKHYFEAFGVDNIALRYCIVYGVGRQQRHGNYPVQLIDNPAWGRKGVVNFGDDEPNWLYVKDAARATLLACTVPTTKSRAFTITGDIMKTSDLRDYVLSLLPDAEIELLPGKYTSAWKYVTSEAEEELGYKMSYTAKEGAREIINTIRLKRNLPPV